MADRTLTITSGLPFKLEINVTLPTNRTYWLTDSDFEILAQIREEKKSSAALVKDLADYIVVTTIDDDNFRINFSMTGADTRTVLKGGFYDILMSDPGTTDERAIILSKGPVKRLDIITADEKDAP